MPKEISHQICTGMQVVDGLKQGDYLHRAVRAVFAVHCEQAGFLGEQEWLEDVAGAGGHGDDVDVAGVWTELVLEVPSHLEDAHNLGRVFRVPAERPDKRSRIGDLT